MSITTHGHPTPDDTTTNTMRASRHAVTILAFCASLGCGPNLVEDGDGFGTGETGLGATGGTGSSSPSVWAETACVESDHGVVQKVARHRDATDTWLIVVTWQTIAGWLDAGLAAQVGDYNDACASGSPKNFFESSICLAFEGQTACFAGEDGLYTRVSHVCNLTGDFVAPWPGWICDGGADMGPSPWDAVLCAADVESDCVGVDDNDFMVVKPTCWVEAHEAPVGCESADPPGWAVGEAWGPCPIDPVSGIYTLCNSETLACVPANNATANMCLPLDACPESVPIGKGAELGFGDACYPRCDSDQDCSDGMICAMADGDGDSMCAWPFD